MYPEIIQVTKSCGYLGGINRVYFILTTIRRIVSNNTHYVLSAATIRSFDDHCYISSANFGVDANPTCIFRVFSGSSFFAIAFQPIG